MRYLLTLHLLIISIFSNAQTKAHQWADSVYNTLTPTERIGQLMLVRLSTIEVSTKKITFFDKEVEDLVKKYNVGGVLIFQGTPQQQAEAINKLQKAAKTPIMISIDGEWGVGQRLTDSVASLPKLMMLGATSNPNLAYKYGAAIAAQCKRLGIHVNFGPVVDVNNNAQNPVINDRSFGEDKFKVANYGIAYMKGMQENGVMACAKHFPGHGDVTVDSHYDLPVINKTLAQLDELELFPFKEIFKAGVGSVMIAHLYIPAIDKTTNRATSISEKNVQDLMRKKLGYEGLTFTDALEMKGVQKFFQGGSAAVEALKAGNDILCLPVDVPQAIAAIEKAIKNNELTWRDIELHCKKVLRAKYEYVLPNIMPIGINNITADLNKDIPILKQQIAEEAITLLSNKNSAFFPFSEQQNVAYVGIGLSSENTFALRMAQEHNAVNFYIDPRKLNTTEISKTLTALKDFKYVVVGIHNTSRSATTNYGINDNIIKLVQQINSQNTTILFHFGNAYGAKSWCEFNNLVVAYEDDPIIQNVAVDMLQGKLPFKGKLPVSICNSYKLNSGIILPEKKK